MNKPVIYTDHKDPTLTAYLKDISKCKIYPQEEVIEFIKKAQTGDTKAREIVVKSNLRFVVTVAKRWQGRGVPLMDLISEGNRGLLHAIDLFDPTRGIPFISYAVHWIKQYMYQSIYWTGREIRLPVSQQIRVIQLLKASSEFVKEHMRQPSAQELAHITGIDEADINYLAQFSNKLVSMDDYLGGDSENNQVSDVISDGNPLFDEQINKEYLYGELEKTLGKLSIREHDIICMIFGFGRDPMDNKLIGDMYGIGTERVRQIKDSALKKLRTRFNSHMSELLK